MENERLEHKGASGMRHFLVAGVVCAGFNFFDAGFFGASHGNWTYHDCVQDCRDNLPPGTTLQQCMIEKRCIQYPRPHRTYKDCARQCEAMVRETGQTLQQCLARYVCSQFPRE